MHFPHDASQYQTIALIGKGAASEVYQAHCLTNDRDLAIKIIDLDDYAMDMDFLRQEVAFWSSSKHANIVGYYGSFVTGKDLYILMEYLSGGSVYDILKYAFRTGFDDEMIIATILKSILSALSYIHQNGQIHRDIKPGNVIIGQDGVVKIGDFGVAATLLEEGQRKRARYTQIGTPCYMAPEVLQGGGHTEKADIWSLGITAIELATGCAPYATLSQVAIVQKILKAPPPQLPRDREFTPEFRDFVKKCMNFTPSKRPSSDDLLQHPFLLKASDASYIVDYVLKDLPPLADRFLASQNESDAALDLLGREANLSGNFLLDLAPAPATPSAPMSCPVQWSFLDDKEDPVKKGRFTIQRSRASDTEASPIAAIPVQERGPSANSTDTDLTKKVAELTVEVKALREENRLMREKLDQIISLLQ